MIFLSSYNRAICVFLISQGLAWFGLAGNVIVIFSQWDQFGGITQITGKSDT